LTMAGCFAEETQGFPHLRFSLIDRA